MHSTIPRSTSSRLVPRSSTPTLSPACPWSSSLRNISTPVHVVVRVSPSPTISSSSPTFTIPRSIRPVTTVPRPVIVNTSSTGIRYGLSSSRTGSGMNESHASISFWIDCAPYSDVSPSSALSAEPRMIGVVSPG